VLGPCRDHSPPTRTPSPRSRSEWVHELVDGSTVAHHVRFSVVHSGRYHDLEPTGKRLELSEMIFQRFDRDLISESRRMTYPEGVYATLASK